MTKVTISDNALGLDPAKEHLGLTYSISWAKEVRDEILVVRGCSAILE
jgi:hypothetical protein